MKKLNFPLIIGTLILALLLVIIIFPGWFTDKSPYNMQKMIFSTVDGTLDIQTAPYPPSKDFIMGSDDLGRDIYSLIIHGTGLTLLMGVLIALGRFIIAMPMAISAGFGNNLSKNIIRQFGILFSAIPALLISVIILELDFFASLDKGSSIAAFVIVLSLTGWPKLGNLLMERVDGINSKPFIKGEVATGKSRFRIALENVFSHLASETTVLFFMEIARALSMIMQLGIFSIYVGLLKIIMDTEGGVTAVDVSFEPEWASMLASSRSFITVAPWAVLFPALAFFISVLGFNLFGEGLRNNLQKRDSMFVPRFRKFMTFNLGYIWGSYKKRSKIIAVSTVVALTLSITIIALAGGGQYVIDDYSGVLPGYETVIAGSTEASDMAGFISERMRELGIEPLADDYVIEYEFPAMCLVSEPDMSIGGEAVEYGEDYEFRTAVSGIFTGEVFDATSLDMFNLDDFGIMNGKFVMIDKSFYNDAAISYFIRTISENTDVSGILIVNRVYEDMEGLLAREGDEYPVVRISQQLAENIKETPGIEISVSAEIKKLGTSGRNIFGILKGEDKYLNEEAIVVALGYNYLDEEGRDILGFYLKIMEEICSLEKNSRSVIFMFTDGTNSEYSNGLHGVAEDFPYSTSKVKIFLDLTGLTETTFDNINFARKQAPYTRAYAWSLAEQIEKELKSMKIGFEEPESVNYNGEFYYVDNYASNAMFWNNGIASVRITDTEEGNGTHDIYEIGEIILKTINNNNY